MGSPGVFQDVHYFTNISSYCYVTNNDTTILLEIWLKILVLSIFKVSGDFDAVKLQEADFLCNVQGLYIPMLCDFAWLIWQELNIEIEISINEMLSTISQKFYSNAIIKPMNINYVQSIFSRYAILTNLTDFPLDFYSLQFFVLIIW